MFQQQPSSVPYFIFVSHIHPFSFSLPLSHPPPFFLPSLPPSFPPSLLPSLSPSLSLPPSFSQMLKGFTRLQATWKAQKLSRQFRRTRRRIRGFQRYCRGYIARRRFRTRLQSIIKLQALFRMIMAKRRVSYYGNTTVWIMET